MCQTLCRQILYFPEAFFEAPERPTERFRYKLNNLVKASEAKGATTIKETTHHSIP